MTKKEQDAFIESMELGKQQTLFFTADLGVSVQILTGLAGLITLTVGMGVTYFLYESMNFEGDWVCSTVASAFVSSVA